MATTIPTKKIIKIKNNPSREVGASATDRKRIARKQSKVSSLPASEEREQKATGTVESVGKGVITDIKPR